MSETKIIAVTNQKGGVGKTTTSINVAYYLAKFGNKVLLLDFDPQGNATSGLGFLKDDVKITMAEVILGKNKLSDCIIPTKEKNLFIAPSMPTLADAELNLTKAEKRFRRLQIAISSVEGEYDYVIIDCPPSLSLLTVKALAAAQYVVLPVQAEFYALEGLSQLINSMGLVGKNVNPTLSLLGVLPTMMDSRTTLSGQVHSEIAKFFPNKIFKTSIPRNIRLAEAPSHGVPVGVYDRFSKGARAYKAVTKEIMERVGD